MADHKLKGCQILIAEDEYLLADDLRDELSQLGADVLGPVPSVDEAATLIRAQTKIDAAVLDINLRGKMVFPIADLLKERGIPFLFATGYDEWAVPDRFADIMRVEKPLKAYRIADLVQTMIA